MCQGSYRTRTGALLGSFLQVASGESFPPQTSQAHERVRGEGGGVFVVQRSGDIGGPIFEKHVSGPGL